MAILIRHEDRVPTVRAVEHGTFSGMSDGYSAPVAVDEDLAELAEAHGVATWYEDTKRERVDVEASVVAAVLAQLGVDAGTPVAVGQELTRLRERRQRATLPGTVVVRQATSRRVDRPAVVHCEDGSRREVTGVLGPDLPLGWHRLETMDQQVHLLVAPARVPQPPPTWGWALQLYAAWSATSWGMGDLADLSTFLQWAADESGAGFVLLNPLQVVTPCLPIEPSPYSPSSRRFANPLYLGIEHTHAYAHADSGIRAQVDGMRPPNAELVDYDQVWLAKQAALELLRPFDNRPMPDADPALRDFATFCALAEKHGPSWRQWPAPLRHPASVEVVAARSELAPRVAFHVWLQHLCDEQLATAHRTARNAGMAVGMVHDLPVGAGPDGADAWALQDTLAADVRVGAPPDPFNQQGQDWNLPPWRPDRLADSGYRPYRDMLQALLRHSDGIRVDHVAGLWRLWWIPPGEPPTRGTYVRYDAEAMLGALALKAHRSQAIVIGEDLGTVPPEVTAGLHERNMLSSAVLWFARNEDAPGQPLLPPQRWPRQAMASISTHDLPTAAGFLHGEHVRVRAELGVLTNPVEVEQERADRERQEMLDMLVEQGLLATGCAIDEEVLPALHALLARTPCRLLVVSPYDALRELRQPNQPGILDKYPNWRIPLPVSIEQLRNDPRVPPIVRALSREPTS
jgi:4-alpha-glucanotransferase